MCIDWTQILLAVIAILGTIIEMYLIPWLKERYANEKFAKCIDMVNSFAAGAEQIAKRDGYDGQWKKQYVISLLEKNGYKVDSTLDSFIEAAVHDIRNDSMMVGK